MMTSPSIPRELSDKVVEDYFELRDEALNWLAQWCETSLDTGQANAGRKGWSDFNVHDPGVQIAEVVCHALTELAYRARVPVVTLLQDPRGVIDWKKGALFAPPDILPMDPLTAADYRKLLLDRFHQIHQVWLFPGARGHHRVWLCFEGSLPEEQARVRTRAQALLERKRNMGEYFTVLSPPDTVHSCPMPDLKLKQLIELTRETLTEQPVLVSMAHLLKLGHSLTDILTGPLLKHGIFPDESMSSAHDWKQALSTILAALSERNVAVDAGADLDDLLPAGCTLAALIEALIPSTYAGESEGEGNSHSFNAAEEPHSQSFRCQRNAPSTLLLRSSGWKMPQADPGWQCQDLPEFHPLQLSFPPNYALGTDELPLSSTPLRQAQVRQLRGYLLHFEQLMRNYLAQLAHLPSLLSVRPQQRTYFVEPVYEVPNIMPLLKGYNTEGLKLGHVAERALTKNYREDPVNPYRRQLADLDESAKEFARRRNQFLDHLLARFGESFGPAKGTTYETIHNKEKLLQHLPKLGRRRAAAGGSGRASGLEEKLTLLLQRDSQQPGGAAQGKFYFIVEDGLLSPAGDTAEAFGLTHVLVNWTGNRLNPAFKDYVEALIAEHSAAHLCHRFLWLERDHCGEDAVSLSDFRERYDFWLGARSNAVAEDATAVAAAAAGLRAWLQQQMANPALVANADDHEQF